MQIPDSLRPILKEDLNAGQITISIENLLERLDKTAEAILKLKKRLGEEENRDLLRNVFMIRLWLHTFSGLKNLAEFVEEIAGVNYLPQSLGQK